MTWIKAVQRPKVTSLAVGERVAFKAYGPHFSAAKRQPQKTSLRARSVDSSEHNTMTLKESKLIQMIQGVSDPIAPPMDGGEESRRRSSIDEFVAEMEAASPEAEPLSLESRQRLLGGWALMYASSGTVVTRSLIGRALNLLSKLPHVGLSDIAQTLDERNGSLITDNAAKFGLGPLGTWEIVIYGQWKVESPTLAKVGFDGMSFQLVNYLGLPSKGPKLNLPTNGNRVAEFETTYLSDSLRISRGSSRKLFVFRKVEA